MAWRPRKSFRIGKGFRINLSRKGIGWSAGIPGIIRFGVGGDGRRRLSAGAGLFRQESQWSGSNSGGHSSSGCCGCLAIIIVGFVGVGLIGGFFSSSSSSPGTTNVSSSSSTTTEVSRPYGAQPATNSLQAMKKSQQGENNAPQLELPTENRNWRHKDGRAMFWQSDCAGSRRRNNHH
jgi:hypothetical protein